MAAAASGSFSSGAWPTPGTRASFMLGADLCILAAVSAVSKSLLRSADQQERLLRQRGEQRPQVEPGSFAAALLNGSAIAMS